MIYRCSVLFPARYIAKNLFFSRTGALISDMMVVNFELNFLPFFASSSSILFVCKNVKFIKQNYLPLNNYKFQGSGAQNLK